MKHALHALRIDALNLSVLAEPLASTLQALVDGVLALKQAQRDLLDTETAQGLQREDQLRLGRDRGIRANEQQPKHVVVNLLLRIANLDLREIALVPFLTTKLVEHVIVRDTI